MPRCCLPGTRRAPTSAAYEGGRIAQVPALEAIAQWSAPPALDTRWAIQSVSILNSETSTVQASLT